MYDGDWLRRRVTSISRSAALQGRLRNAEDTVGDSRARSPSEGTRPLCQACALRRRSCWWWSPASPPARTARTRRPSLRRPRRAGDLADGSLGQVGRRGAETPGRRPGFVPGAHRHDIPGRTQRVLRQQGGGAPSTTTCNCGAGAASTRRAVTVPLIQLDFKAADDHPTKEKTMKRFPTRSPSILWAPHDHQPGKLHRAVLPVPTKGPKSTSPYVDAGMFTSVGRAEGASDQAEGPDDDPELGLPAPGGRTGLRGRGEVAVGGPGRRNPHPVAAIGARIDQVFGRVDPGTAVCGGHTLGSAWSRRAPNG